MGNRYSHIIPPNSTCAGYRCQRAVKEDGTSFIFECLECGDKSLFCSQVHRDEKEAWHARRCQGRRQNQTAAHTVNHDMSKFGIGESDSTRKEESDSDDEGDYEDCLTDDEGDEEDERLGDSEAGNREREDKDENQEAGPKPHVVSTRKSDDAKDLEAVYQYATNPEDDSLDYSELGIYTREQLEEGKALARSYESEQEWARGRNDGANGAPISNDHQRAESRLRSLSQRLTGSYRQGRLSSRDHDRSPVDARRVATPTRPSDSSSGLDAFPDDGLGDGYDVSDEEERRRRRQFLRQTQEEGNEHEHENDNDQEEQEGSNEDAANKDIDSETGSAETMEELQDNFSSILMVHAGATFRDNEPISEATDGGDAFANRVSPATTSETPADVEGIDPSNEAFDANEHQEHTQVKDDDTESLPSNTSEEFPFNDDLGDKRDATQADAVPNEPRKASEFEKWSEEFRKQMTLKRDNPKNSDEVDSDLYQDDKLKEKPNESQQYVDADDAKCSSIGVRLGLSTDEIWEAFAADRIERERQNNN